jgi:hypothetical protein
MPVRRRYGCKHLARLILAGVSLWLFSPLPAGAQTDLTSRQLVALSSADAGQKAKSDLLSVLRPFGKFRRGHFRMVDSFEFTTQPYGTEIQGVCRMDALDLQYGPVRSGPTIGAGKTATEDAPRQAYGIEARALFHINSLPANTRQEDDADGIWQAVCDPSRLGDHDNWFRATTVFEAVRAANMFRMAEDQVRSGALKPKPCRKTFFLPGQTCAQAILAVDDLAKFDEVEACDAAQGQACFRITLDGYTNVLTIVADLNDDGGSLTPTAIASIEVEQTLVVS